MTKKTIKYTVPYTVKVTVEISKAIESYVEKMREDYPSYTANDLMRLAIVKYLKNKGCLNENKKYL